MDTKPTAQREGTGGESPATGETGLTGSGPSARSDTPTGKIDTSAGPSRAAVGLELSPMSTEYAVKMPQREFLAGARKLGWELNLKMDDGRDGALYPRLYLHDGSEAGYAWDIREETDLNGHPWTLFTRHGLGDPYHLVSAFGAMDEHHPNWDEAFGWPEDQALALVRRGAEAYFESWTDGGHDPSADGLIEVINDELRLAKAALEEWRKDEAA